MFQSQILDNEKERETREMTQQQDEQDIIYAWDNFDTYENYEEYVARTKIDYPEEVADPESDILSQNAWVYDQTDASSDHYRVMLEEVQKAIDSFGTSYWHVEGTNLGWMHRSGYTNFKAVEAVDFLHAILPKTSIDDCVFTLTWLREASGKVSGMEMTNSHHDAMGEHYVIRPATEEEIEDE